MKLDSRIKEGKKPLDCFDEDIAKQFIGKKGFVTDFLQDFCNLSKVKVSELKTVLHTEAFCYLCGSTGKKYFLPAEWVKEPEKKYRPFSPNEFSGLYAIGDVVTYRIKDCEVIEQSMLIGFQSSDDEDAPGNGYVIIGNCRYGLKELFNNYELQYLAHWQPFGVIDEDKE